MTKQSCQSLSVWLVEWMALDEDSYEHETG